MPPAGPDFYPIVRALLERQVEFIIVGGVAAVLHGSPVMTQDFDIVHSRAAANLERLLAALRDLDAIYRISRCRRLQPQLSHLETLGHQLLATTHADFDVLGAIGHPLLSYDDLLPHTEEMDLGDGLKVRVLDLPTLIELKTQAGRPKDMYNVLHLKEILRETRRKPRRK